MQMDNPGLSDQTKFCVDPGHGMNNRRSGVYDPGAVSMGSPEVQEADVTLDYCLALRDVFNEKGCDVFMTRETKDQPAPLTKRATKAETEGCKVFISLHLNASDNASAHGIEVFYSDEEDKPFAEAVQAALVGVTGFRDRGAKQHDYAVLSFNGPAILIELGFISNRQDREALLTGRMKADICEKIAEVAAGMYP